ncbi:MAG: amidohydrolase [Desulfococcaceae bacterium]|jgi:predicted amidohydrolase YtcJ|nr:amidohydrolase [Desulfococcaceae bacterium]
MNLHSPLLLSNGNIRTLEDKFPFAHTLLISGGRIRAVGGDEIRKTAPSHTKIIDLEGRTVLPGMTDPHFHFYEWAMLRRNLSLSAAVSLDDLLFRVRNATHEKTKGDWIIGQGWNEADWPVRQMPGRKDLDQAAPDHPLILWRCDLHLAAVNSPALKKAGIQKNTADPPEGKIGRDASGEPDGILKESAINLIRNVIPSPSDRDIIRAMQEGIPALHGLGLTGIHDVRIMNDQKSAAAFRAWTRIRENGELRLRCHVTLSGDYLEDALALGLRSGFGDEYLRIGHVKFFADGGMGARTAWMTAAYADAAYGMPLISMKKLEKMIRTADAKGLAVMVHAIGDRANREVIGIFERLVSAPRPHSPCGPSVPHRMEHLQMIRPEDVKRLSRLNVVACMQPHNMILDMNMVDECIGSEAVYVYAFKNILNAGIPLMFGSDAPVCDPSPFVNIHAAVTRQRKDGSPEGGWYPEQRISVDAALKAYTSVPAQVHGLADISGTIRPGKQADLIVTDRDIYTVDPMEIADTKVEMCIFDGEIVRDCRQ